MKYAKTVLLAASISVLSAHHSAGAGEMIEKSKEAQAQIAEIPAAAVRNITAAQRMNTGQQLPGEARKAHPPGAQALMALGIALIVTPAMFRGAFSN
jgi:hypothetical protein